MPAKARTGHRGQKTPSYVTPRTPRISTSKGKLNSAETPTCCRDTQLLARGVQWAKQTKQGWGHVNQRKKPAWQVGEQQLSLLWAAKDGQVCPAGEAEVCPRSWSHLVPRPSSRRKSSVWHCSFTAPKTGVADHKISGRVSPKQGDYTLVEISDRHICTHPIKTHMTSISSPDSFSKYYVLVLKILTLIYFLSTFFILKINFLCSESGTKIGGDGKSNVFQFSISVVTFQNHINHKAYIFELEKCLWGKP